MQHLLSIMYWQGQRGSCFSKINYFAARAQATTSQIISSPLKYAISLRTCVCSA